MQCVHSKRNTRLQEKKSYVSAAKEAAKRELNREGQKKKQAYIKLKEPPIRRRDEPMKN